MRPMECKKLMAEDLYAQFHDSNAAKYEREQFEKVFSQNDMPIFSIRKLMGKKTAPLIDILGAINLFPNKKEIRRLFEQGALKVDEQKITDCSFPCTHSN
jgi:tyrosyl-tRNA synthetase